jgi:hypothetical protein
MWQTQRLIDEETDQRPSAGRWNGWRKRDWSGAKMIGLDWIASEAEAAMKPIARWDIDHSHSILATNGTAARRENEVTRLPSLSGPDTRRSHGRALFLYSMEG